jgi:hypothetical protein
MSQSEMGICKAVCPADTWTGFVYVDTTCLQLLSVHLSEILRVVRYISDYSLPRLCPSPDVLEIISHNKYKIKHRFSVNESVPEFRLK